MKKVLLGILFAVTGMAALAKETVTIYYAFSPADTMANYSRTLVEEANRIQNKYTFLFDTKPGAGNTVAANFVLNNPNSILATSSAFFIRPIFFPNESYLINNFKELLPQCEAPMGIASLKYRSWRDVPTNRPLTVGVSGLGVTTHLVASEIAIRYPNLQIIPFKSTNDAILATAGGHTDFAVGFINDTVKWTTTDTPADKRLTVLGVTGSKAIRGIPTLISQGFPQTLAELNAPHHLVVPATTPDAKFKEWRDILFRASKAESVQDSYTIDSAVPLDSIADSNIQPWFYKQQMLWKKIGSNIKLEK
jgi:tripartite-type tricarboxylate transporter receptor subunit TctC